MKSIKVKTIEEKNIAKIAVSMLIGLAVMVVFAPQVMATFNRFAAELNYGFGYGIDGGSVGYGYGYGSSVSVSGSNNLISDVGATTSTLTFTVSGQYMFCRLEDGSGDFTAYSGSTVNSSAYATYAYYASGRQTFSGLTSGTSYTLRCFDVTGSMSTATAAPSGTSSSAPGGTTGGTPPSVTSVPTVTTTGEATVTADTSGTATATTSDGGTITVSVPVGAVTNSSSISIAPSSASSAPAPTSGLFMVGNNVFEINSTGDTEFNQDITLTFSYSDDQVSGLDEGSLAVHWYNTETGSWEQLPSTVDPATNTVTATTNHLTTFAVMAAEAVSEAEVLPGRPAEGASLEAEAAAIPVAGDLIGEAIDSAEDWAIVHFIAYGTTAKTVELGSRERAGLVGDFKTIHDRLPTASADWNDIAKIANGQKPTQRKISREAWALVEFVKVYHRLPDFSNWHDEMAVWYVAYSLRNPVRNIDSERAAIWTFRTVYHKFPASSSEWSIMRAIAYSGAAR